MISFFERGYRVIMGRLFLLSCIYTSIILGTSAASTTEYAVPNSTDSDYDLPPYLVGKHESLRSCIMVDLEREYYELLSNGSALLKGRNEIINETFYIIINETLHICYPSNQVEETKQVDFTSYITVIGLAISMISLFLHLVVFCLVPSLRNLPGWNLATLCACLFISYSLILVIGSGKAVYYRDACSALAYVTHFFLFSSFLWMSILSFDVFMSLLRATGKFQNSSARFRGWKFGLYCLCAFGIAVLFSVLTVLADTLDIVPEKYKPEFHTFCWFSRKMPLLIFFAGPAILLSCLNFVLFGASAYIIYVNKRKCDQDAQQPVLKRMYLMYFRLSVVMGVTWIVGIAANIVSMDWLWFIFVLLNTLQGFFIFLAFTCSEKVKKHFRQKIFGARRFSGQSTTPTFQSYCVNSNSSEKDIDKPVECSK